MPSRLLETVALLLKTSDARYAPLRYAHMLRGFSFYVWPQSNTTGSSTSEVLPSCGAADVLFAHSLLGRGKEAFDADPQLANLLLAPYFQQAIAQSQSSWRRVIAKAVEHGMRACIQQRVGLF